MRVISKTNASEVEYPPSSGNVYQPGPDGVFEMPEHVGREITKKHASQWAREEALAGTQRRDRAAKLRNPRVAADVISRLEQRVETLEAQVAELVSFVDEAPAEPEPEAAFEGEDGDGEQSDPQDETASGGAEDSGESGEQSDAEPEPRPAAKRATAPRRGSPKGK